MSTMHLSRQQCDELRRKHGELTTRVEDVRGGADAPHDPRDVDAKFRECFGLGVRPLDERQIATLTSRVRGIESDSIADL